MRGLQFPFLLKLIIRLGFGIRSPRMKIIGQELAWEIEAKGKCVKRFKKGDQVLELPVLNWRLYRVQMSGGRRGGDNTTGQYDL